MIMRRRAALVVLCPLCTILASCPPTPQPPPTDTDAATPTPDTTPELDSVAPSSACERACARMAAIPCKEGIDAMCVPTCTHVVVTQLTAYGVGCIGDATSAAAVRGCRGGRCTAP